MALEQVKSRARGNDGANSSRKTKNEGSQSRFGCSPCHLRSVPLMIALEPRGGCLRFVVGIVRSALAFSIFFSCSDPAAIKDGLVSGVSGP